LNQDRLFTMNKIIKLNTDNIIIDPAGQSEMITNACNHNTKMNVIGLCQSGDYILVTLEEEETFKDLTYVLAPFNTNNVDEISTEISTRYFAGFSFLGGLDVKAEKWGLFAQKKSE
jgi:hypothetical protein